MTPIILCHGGYDLKGIDTTVTLKLPSCCSFLRNLIDIYHGGTIDGNWTMAYPAIHKPSKTYLIAGRVGPHVWGPTLPAIRLWRPILPIAKFSWLERNANFYTIKFSIKSPCLHPTFGSPFTPKPLFQWYPQSNEIILNLGMKCWNSAINAQGSRIIIMAVKVGAVKGFQEKGKKGWKQDETQLATKIDVFLSSNVPTPLECDHQNWCFLS